VATILEDKNKAFELGAEDFCTKPVNPEWLIKNLYKWGIQPKKSTILIADDEEVWRYLLRNILSEGGYNILEAKNGVECLKLMRQKKPDLVFLDIIMPEMDGFEVLNEMRIDPQLKDVPVIITTSKTLDEQEKEYIISSLTSILPKKTLDKDKVIAKVISILKASVSDNKLNRS